MPSVTMHRMSILNYHNTFNYSTFANITSDNRLANVYENQHMNIKMTHMHYISNYSRKRNIIIEF